MIISYFIFMDWSRSRSISRHGSRSGSSDKSISRSWSSDRSISRSWSGASAGSRVWSFSEDYSISQSDKTSFKEIKCEKDVFIKLSPEHMFVGIEI